MNRSRQPRVLKRPAANQPQAWLLFSSGRQKGFYCPTYVYIQNTLRAPRLCIRRPRV